MVFTTIVAACLALLMGVSGLSKVRNFRAFQGVVKQYELMPTGVVPLASAAVVAAELCVPVLSFVSLSSALFLAAFLLGGYASGIAINLLRGRTHIDCGCSLNAKTDQRIHWGMVGRNTVLVLGALAGVWAMPISAMALTGHWLETVSIAASVGVLALLYTAFEHALRFAAYKKGA